LNFLVNASACGLPQFGNLLAITDKQERENRGKPCCDYCDHCDVHAIGVSPKKLIVKTLFTEIKKLYSYKNESKFKWLFNAKKLAQHFGACWLLAKSCQNLKKLAL
jgi:hypothetical protein